MSEYRIKLADNTIESSELEALAHWIRSAKQLTKGDLTKKFENNFAEYVGSERALFVNSGSSANLLILTALLETGRIQKRRVIAPAISWPTTVAPAMQLGLDIKLCDCDIEDLGYDLNHFEELCRTYRPDIAIIVHVLGHPNKLEQIECLCKKYGVKLVEDACEALGTVYRGRHAGTFGIAGSYSLYYGHQLSTIEGGLVVTSDSALYDTVLSLRAHGWARDVNSETRTKWEREYNVDEVRSLYTFYFPGYNFRPTDVNAFLGLLQLKKADSVAIRRQENYLNYRQRLKGSYWVQRSEHDRVSNFAFGTLVENRIEVYRHFQQRGIETRPLLCGSIGRQPFWIKSRGETRLAKADIVHDHGIYLPNHLGIGASEIALVETELRAIGRPIYFDTAVERGTGNN
jgi:CDP-6-deoxy-D-xylo-4-hexulose-3-dehydrase